MISLFVKMECDGILKRKRDIMFKDQRSFIFYHTLDKISKNIYHLRCDDVSLQRQNK